MKNNKKLPYSIAIVIYPANFQLLPQFLKHLKMALKNRTPHIAIYSNATSIKQETHLKELIHASPLKIELQTTAEILPICVSRNRVWKMIKTKWTVMFDPDIIIDEHYFDALDNALIKYPNTKAFAGGFGISKSSTIGFYEGVMDCLVQFRINALTPFEKTSIQKKLSYHATNAHTFTTQLKSILTPLEGHQTDYLQGFNMILHQDVLKKLNGFDETFYTAEDRELGMRITKSGGTIIYCPLMWVNHNYEFDISDIIKRKHNHAVGMGLLRKKYPTTSNTKIKIIPWIASSLETLYVPKQYIFFRKSLIARAYLALALNMYIYKTLISEYGSNNSQIKSWKYNRDKET